MGHASAYAADAGRAAHRDDGVGDQSEPADPGREPDAVGRGETLKLITNRDVLRMDQEAVGQGKMIASAPSPKLQAWSVEVGGGKHYVAVFNLSDAPVSFYGALGSLGMDIASGRRVKLDVWGGKALSKSSVIAPHGCVLMVSM